MTLRPLPEVLADEWNAATHEVIEAARDAADKMPRYLLTRAEGARLVRAIVAMEKIEQAAAAKRIKTDRQQQEGA
ncbi:MAG TPA: hypothetical protein VIO57_10140 [Chloroflexota bacterium]|jgi:hypothetical protein